MIHSELNNSLVDLASSLERNGGLLKFVLESFILVDKLLDFGIASVDSGLELMLIAFQFEDDALVVLLPVVYDILLLVVVHSCHFELHSQSLDVFAILFQLRT
jgi:hypothetical protein